MAIHDGCTVQLRYTLTDADTGEQLDASGEEPFVYTHGAGEILPALEAALAGREAGDVLTLTLSPEEAYGEREEALVQRVERARLPEGPVEIGTAFEAEMPWGPHIFRVVAMEGDEVVLDGNHPLAGRTLTFSLEVVSVQES